MASERKAMVDEQGWFHCPCGKRHGRGPVNGVDVWRCLGCGSAYRVHGVVELRGPAPHYPDGLAAARGAGDADK